MKPMKLLSDRLAFAISHKKEADLNAGKVNQATIAKAAGVSPATVSYWFNDTNGISGELARKVGAYLLVDPVWLETGKPPASGAVLDAPSMDLVYLDGEEIRLITQWRRCNDMGRELIRVATETATSSSTNIADDRSVKISA